MSAIFHAGGWISSRGQDFLHISTRFVIILFLTKSAPNREKT